MQQQHGMQLVLPALAMGLGTFMQVLMSAPDNMQQSSYSLAASGRAYG